MTKIWKNSVGFVLLWTLTLWGGLSAKTVELTSTTNTNVPLAISVIQPDMGQGVMTLVQIFSNTFTDGPINILIDGGSSSGNDYLTTGLDFIYEALGNRLVLDFIIVTHPDEDHISLLAGAVSGSTLGVFGATDIQIGTVFDLGTDRMTTAYYGQNTDIGGLYETALNAARTAGRIASRTIVDGSNQIEIPLANIMGHSPTYNGALTFYEVSLRILAGSSRCNGISSGMSAQLSKNLDSIVSGLLVRERVPPQNVGDPTIYNNIFRYLNFGDLETRVVYEQMSLSSGQMVQTAHPHSLASAVPVGAIHYPHVNELNNQIIADFGPRIDVQTAAHHGLNSAYNPCQNALIPCTLTLISGVSRRWQPLNWVMGPGYSMAFNTFLYVVNRVTDFEGQCIRQAAECVVGKLVGNNNYDSSNQLYFDRTNDPQTQGTTAAQVLFIVDANFGVSSRVARVTIDAALGIVELPADLSDVIPLPITRSPVN
ncbi:MAG: hypothetical protein AAFQ83_24295 [Bacteroidota bacterium]